MEPSGKKSEPGKRQAKRGKGKRFKKDKDDVCRILEDKIGLSNEELQASYAEFMELCPQAVTTKLPNLPTKTMQATTTWPLTISLGNAFHRVK